MNDLPTIDFTESRRVIQRAQDRSKAGKRLSRKDRTIVQLADLLKQSAELVEERNKQLELVGTGRAGSGGPGGTARWPVDAVTVKIPSAQAFVVGMVPNDLLKRIDSFARGVQQAALVAGNGILVGEQRALQLLSNDFLRVFRPEIEEIEEIEKRGE